MKIGIPRALYYYYFDNLWINYFKNLGLEVVISKETDKEIIDLGNKYSIDEMCLSLKIFLGHVAYLENKCDYILIPHIDNFNCKNQMCSNFSSLYDLVNNLFDFKILDYEINYEQNKKEKQGLIKIGKNLKFTKKQCRSAYKQAYLVFNHEKKKAIMENAIKLKSEKNKILLVGHSYNLNDNYVSKTILNYLKKFDCEIIYSDRFDEVSTNNLSKYLSRELYWKYSKENIGSIILCQDKIDGIIFLTTFPCGLDSLVNELVMRKINTPYLNLIIDDLDSAAGIETRIESFIDIISQK